MRTGNEAKVVVTNNKNQSNESKQKRVDIVNKQIDILWAKRQRRQCLE